MFLLKIKNTGLKISNILVTQNTVKLISLHTEYTVIDFALSSFQCKQQFCFSAFNFNINFIFYIHLKISIKSNYFNTIA